MGRVWSTIDSMIGPGIDERDLRLTVRMIREHWTAILRALTRGGTVPWHRNSHVSPSPPFPTEWGYMREILENAPLPAYVALAIEGAEGKLDDIEWFQSDPDSAPKYRQNVAYCEICRQIAHDEEDVDLWDGPIGTDRFFANWGARLEGPWVWNNRNGRNTGTGRNRRVEAQ
jgi:hypothetical protein